MVAVSWTDLRGRLLVVVAAAGFGLMPIFAQYAYAEGMGVQTLLLLRFTIAAAALLGYLALTRRLVWPGRRALARLAVLGGVLYAAQSTLYFSAVRYISPTLAVLLLYLYPALVVLLTAVVERTPPSLTRLASIGLSLVGVVIVLGAPTGEVRLAGVLLALGAALTYAVYIVAGDRFSSTLPPFTTAAYVIAFAAVSFAVTGVARGAVDLTISPRGWAAVAGVAVISTIVAIGCFFAGMAAVGPAQAAILSVVEPVVSVAATALLLHKGLSALQIVGGVLVLAAAVWGVAGGGDRRTPPPVATRPTRPVGRG
ncbi:DMT multidrug transporter [Couchioplanes caeruleus subsp. azureus]|nr:DMT multidrug transporter [Couchioplanes caeruleus subsp. azureus]